MKRFVRPGQKVVVKPNIGWDRSPEQAANTNPDVVVAVVRMCLEAGAGEVLVFDRTCNDQRLCYRRSGVAGWNRGRIHTDFDDKIVDLNLGRRSDLVVLDATRILVAHGPQGGNLADVRHPGVVVAGTDVVAVDAYGTRFFGKTPKEIPHIVRAAERGLGTMDLGKVAVREETV